MKSNPPKVSSRDSRASTVEPSKRQVTEAYRLLAEIQQLLDDYAPAWYTEDLSDRLREAIEIAGPQYTASGLPPRTVNNGVRRQTN